MNTKLKAKWVSELRSGNYTQARGALFRETEGYCCLGILCKAVGAEFEKVEGSAQWWPVLDGKRLDPHNGDEYIGREFREKIGLEQVPQYDLAKMNDSGKSFAEIADYIEANL